MNQTALDRAVLDTLKAVHNLGANRYNAGDHTAAFRLYQGALTVARPFLAARPAVQKLVADGLDEVQRSAADDRLKAFRLHEVMDGVRAEIKAEYRKAREARESCTAEAGGRVLISGRPAAGACVQFYPPGGLVPAALAVTGTDGRFALSLMLPPGRYTVALIGTDVPADYQAVGTTPLTVQLEAGENELALETA